MLKKINEALNFLQLFIISLLLLFFNLFLISEAKTPPEEQDITAKAIYKMPYLLIEYSGANIIGEEVKKSHEIAKKEECENQLLVAKKEIIDEKIIVKTERPIILINLRFLFEVI